MASVSIELKGLQGLRNKLVGLLPSVREAARQAVAETALLTESDAKQFAPVDTGRLRASIHADFAPNGLSATVSTEVDYAVFVEFGTRYQQAQPFMGPAFEKNRLGFIESLKRAGLTAK